MALHHIVVQRLAFIKYLYQTAITQSQSPSPLNCASILTMHDAIELFLQLASEHLNVGSERPAFIEYWDILNKKIAPLELAQKESMRRLNKARVAIKHHGTFPSELDIESFRASTTNFFEDNTSLVFKVNLHEISLVEFVNPEISRQKLKDAEIAISQGDTLKALDDIAIAFDKMISDYENRKRTPFSDSPFYFGRDLTFQTSFCMGLNGGLDSYERSMAEFVDRVKESIEAMQNAIKILALGMDYRKYSKFKGLTPQLVRLMNGQYYSTRRFDEKQKPSVEDTRFCIHFVIESALALSQFDYSLKKE